MINFSKAFIGSEEYRAVKKVLKSGWITTSKVTKKFEEEFADYVGAKYAVAVSSCTVGLEMCVRYHDVKDELVIVPSFTFCATAQAVENAGGKVIFGEIEPENLCLDNNSFIVKHSLGLAKLIIPVHLGSNKAFTDYAMPVVEDSAHRIEKDQCKDNPNMVVFSFYATKNMTTGEGGMICTNNKKEYDWLMKCRSHGRTELVGHGYDVDFCGLKANLPDILSAIGREQLKKLPKMTELRNKAVAKYNELLDNNWCGNHLYPIFRDNRDAFIDYMRDNGVQCSAHFSPLHKMEAYKSYNKFSLPITEILGATEISLPLYPGITNKDIKYICKLIKEYE